MDWTSEMLSEYTNGVPTFKNGDMVKFKDNTSWRGSNVELAPSVEFSKLTGIVINYNVDFSIPNPQPVVNVYWTAIKVYDNHPEYLLELVSRCNDE
jgi:hypothetical protein